MTMSKWAVRLFHDEPIWTCNGEEELFNTEDEAIKAIEDEIKECQWAVEEGYMEDFNFEDYRIVEVV
jgi:hypothetical protein